MQFSETGAFVLGEEDDWFDPTLERDTPLFIDPFLVFAGHPEFPDAHAGIMRYFNRVYEIAAACHATQSGPGWAKLLNTLLFPEVPELCLGFSKGSIDGAGSGAGNAALMRAAVMEAIDAGLVSLDGFEQVALLQKGIGRDLISDATANLIKLDLIRYTQNVCARHGIETQPTAIRHCLLDAERLIWRTGYFELPKNPIKDHGVILVPTCFLGLQPAMNKESFTDFFWDTTDEQLRTELDVEIKSNIDVARIVEIAKRIPDKVRQFFRTLRDGHAPAPYDVVNDPSGVYRGVWDRVAHEYASAHPLVLEAHDEASFLAVIDSLIAQFKEFIEKNGGNEFLWNDAKGGTTATPKHEHAAQLAFHCFAHKYCADNNIMLTPEADFGRGPVDFHFSRGYENQVYLELKLSGSKQLNHGLTKQLPLYIQSGRGNVGYYMVMVLDDAHHTRVNKALALAADLRAETGFDLRTIIIDAPAKQPSASVA